MMSLLPEDPESTILKRLKRPKGDEDAAPESSPQQRSDLQGYGNGDRAGMRAMVESKATR
jgi:membrane protein required for colicin V production